MSRSPKSTVALTVALVALATVPTFAANDACNPNELPSGVSFYSDHCAACHGVGAAGGTSPDGTPAPDLTRLSARAGGQFPAADVADVIRYGGSVPGHLTKPKMPVWSKVFHAECGVSYSRRAIIELVQYLRSLQR